MASAPKNLLGINLETMGIATKRPSDDGYWETVSEWSTCTKLCGGGVQSKQRRCIPPINIGKPCGGEAIL